MISVKHAATHISIHNWYTNVTEDHIGQNVVCIKNYKILPRYICVKFRVQLPTMLMYWLIYEHAYVPTKLSFSFQQVDEAIPACNGMTVQPQWRCKFCLQAI